MLCLCGFELYSRWVPLKNSDDSVVEVSFCYDRETNHHFFSLMFSL